MASSESNLYPNVSFRKQVEVLPPRNGRLQKSYKAQSFPYRPPMAMAERPFSIKKAIVAATFFSSCYFKVELLHNVTLMVIVTSRVTIFEFVKKRTLRGVGGGVVVYSIQMTPVLPDWKWQSIVPNVQNDRLWRIIIMHLATLRGRSTNGSFLYSQSSCKKVEHKGDTLSKTCKGVKTSL